MSAMQLVSLLTLSILAVTFANGDESCPVGREPLETPCLTLDKGGFDRGNSLKEDIDEESWFSSSFSSVSNVFNTIKETFSGESNVKTEQFEEGGDILAGIDMDVMIAEANKLAAMMVSDHLDLSMKDIDRFAVFTKDTEDEPEVEKSDYEYKPVKRREVATVGEEIFLDLGDGVPAKLVARAMDPTLFEIPDFLSAEECDYIISKAKEKGLHVSRLFLDKNVTDRQENKGYSRISESSELNASDVDKEFLERLQSRVARLVGVPPEVVQWSEELAIGKYGVGGHYHAHLDSTDLNPDKLCCFQKQCTNHRDTDVINTDCCRLCRYATVLYYLNDVEEGGETAFPVADLTYTQMRTRSREMNWSNLTEHCYDSQVYIKPEKGKAILWYNHFTDKRGYLGGLSKRSYHGGCDVRKGTKWIATNWVSIPTYKHRYIRSKHRAEGSV